MFFSLFRFLFFLFSCLISALSVFTSSKFFFAIDGSRKFSSSSEDVGERIIVLLLFGRLLLADVAVVFALLLADFVAFFAEVGLGVPSDIFLAY